MGIRRDKNDKENTGKTGLDKFVNSSPDETGEKKDMLKRDTFAFRINPILWLDFEYWCKLNKKTRSDCIEKFILETLGKTKDDYR